MNDLMEKTVLLKRPEQIKEHYLQLIDRHLDELIHGKVTDMLEIEDFADLMFIHPTHLSNTIKAISGSSPCGLYQVKILEVAKILLDDHKQSIREIAFLLTYDPSNFTKWFKKYSGLTPKQYRKEQLFAGAVTAIL